MLKILKKYEQGRKIPKITALRLKLLIQYLSSKRYFADNLSPTEIILVYRTRCKKLSFNFSTSKKFLKKLIFY